MPALAAAVALLATGCAGGEVATETTATTVVTAPPTTTAVTTTVVVTEPVAERFCTEPLPGEVLLDDTSVLDDPDTGPDSWPDEGAYNRWSTRDGPGSAYRPCFVPAEEAAFDDETVVVGVAAGEEARAYAIEQLVAHYVNDRFGDDPLLVSY